MMKLKKKEIIFLKKIKNENKKSMRTKIYGDDYLIIGDVHGDIIYICVCKVEIGPIIPTKFLDTVKGKLGGKINNKEIIEIFQNFNKEHMPENDEEDITTNECYCIIN